ncbi:MAG TPA: hypothetical protein VLE99_06490 [Candidatus Saccharimonadales bacterium]|nr:hypothetical protein [Candidatus Saccharimonadales bacterium]
MTAAKTALRHVRTAVNEAWIVSGDLCVVFTVLNALYESQEEELSGGLLAHALRRLMSCEVQPGGPYGGNDGRVRRDANAAVATFLTHYDVVLPGLQTYLATHAAIDDAAPKLNSTDQQLLHLSARLKKPESREQPRLSDDALRLVDSIWAATRQYIEKLPEPLRTTGLSAWNDMRLADRNHEIVLLPWLFADTLTNANGINGQELQLLGEANVFCWIATVLYDDFIDEEGDPARLPIANVAYRASLERYRQVLVGRPELYARVERWYTAVDRANAWEVAHARARVVDGGLELAALPRYGNCTVLADRAFGHAIGPMLLALQVTGVRAAQLRKIERSLQHFLIARQLHDDIHDWRKDLQVGQLSVVVVDLLQRLRIRPRSYQLSTFVPRLERHFLRSGLSRQCIRLTAHTKACRQMLAASGIAKSAGGFLRLVNELEASAVAAVRIQSSRQAFLRAYQQLR